MKSKIVLVLLVMSAMTGLASASTVAEYIGEEYFASVEPVVTETPDVGYVGSGSGSGYGQVSIAVPDQSTYESDAIVTIGVPLQVYEIPIPYEIPDVWVQPPEVGTCEYPGHPPCTPVEPPEVGTCEYPGHPPCTPVEPPEVWIPEYWYRDVQPPEVWIPENWEIWVDWFWN